MANAFNEYGVETEAFKEALYDVLNPLGDTIVRLLDAGYSIPDIHYALMKHIGFIMSTEQITRTLKKRSEKRASS